MKNILLVLIGFVLIGCSSSNIAKNKTTITNQADFVKLVLARSDYKNRKARDDASKIG